LGLEKRSVLEMFLIAVCRKGLGLDFLSETRISAPLNLWNHRVSTDCMGPVLGLLAQALQEFFQDLVEFLWVIDEKGVAVAVESLQAELVA
jgi:hypothetical protein